MPGDAIATPTRTTVTLGAPSRRASASELDRPQIDSRVARERLAAAETALLDERRLLTADELSALAQ
ncbi:MAG TPA: hypothetical protein VHZ02_18610, partial [Acidimicrobiales bacterium]|nr:hypothetical protein [Acidimicrobiales bacterium]